MLGPSAAHRPRPILPLIALMLVLAAWGTFRLGQYRASQLDLSRFGPCEDVYDALGRDGFVARHQLPYFTVAMLTDGLALMVLIAAGIFGQFRVVGILASVVWLPSMIWHGLGWLVTLAFAS